MEERSQVEEKIRRYLLNSLTPEELEETEHRLLTDSAYLEQVSLLEEELVDAYICEALSPDDQRVFEESYLSTPDGREQVRLAASLKEYALARRFAEPAMPSAAARKTPYWKSLFPTLPGRNMILRVIAATSLIAAITASVALWSSSRLGGSDSQPGSSNASALQTQLLEQQRQNEELSARLRSEQEKRLTTEKALADLEQNRRNRMTTILSLVLLPGRERGSGAGNRLVIGPGAIRVRLYLALRQLDYEKVNVSLQDEDGKVVRSFDSVPATSSGRGKRVEISVPSSLLIDGDYVVRLYGIREGTESAEIGSYYFRVARR